MNKHGQEVSFFVFQCANKPTMVFKECAIQKEPAEIRLEMNRDILKEAGLMSRQILCNQDFNLDDKFCDANELEEAHQKIAIPHQKCSQICFR